MTEITVWDPHGFCSELAEVQSDFVMVREPAQAKVHMLPPYDDRSIKPCATFTVFVDPEPVSHNAQHLYSEQRRARPHNVWAVCAHSPSHAWPTHTVDLYWHMISVLRLNRDCAAITSDSKPWLATALWGGWTPHRSIMLHELQHTALDQRCLINFQRRRDQVIDPRDPKHDFYQNYRTPALADLDLDLFTQRAWQPGFNSMVPLSDQPGSGWISQLIPWHVHDAAMVSIVAETVNYGALDTFFISEKISRPILCAQPFWVFAGQGFLARVRELGFQTYSHFWDESYDSVPDSDCRARAVISSFAQFASRSPEQQLEICDRARSVAMHNRDHMRDLQWLYGDIAQYLRCLIS